jgi:hypothetical protein
MWAGRDAHVKALLDLLRGDDRAMPELQGVS